MEAKIRCKKCDQVDMEYYPGRRKCKKCIQEYQREYQANKYVPVPTDGWKELRCVTCKEVKDSTRFKISRKTLKLKENCMDCKMPKHVDLKRYVQLEQWVDNLIKVSSHTDVRILKHIFEKK